MRPNPSGALSALTMALVLSGCAAVGPDYQPPSVVHLDAISASQFPTSERARTWWQIFGDPQLQWLVEQVRANNAELSVARANIEAAYAVFEDIENDGRPVANIQVSSEAQDQIIPGFGTQRRNVRNYRAGMNLNWSMDVFGKLERAAQAAHANAQASEYAMYDLQIALTAQTVTLYAEYQGLLHRIDVARRNIESIKTTEAVTYSRVEAGYASQLDLLRIKSQRLGVEASIPSLRASASAARNALAALSGQSAATFTLSERPQAALALNTPLAIGEPKALLRQRPDVLQAERQLAAATAHVGVQTADLYPDISISGFVGFLAGDVADFGSQTRAWSVAPSLTWQAFNWGSVRARIDESDANRKAALGQFRQTLLTALTEAQTALDSYSQTQQRLHLLNAQVNASQNSLRLAKLQYEAGAIDILDVLDSERVLLAAEDNLMIAQAQTITDLVEVYRSFGGGFTEQERDPQLLIVGR